MVLKNKKTVVVAMSGGVDSSVAAALLVQEGYRVIGVTMKLWDFTTVGGNLNRESSCCSLDSINDARMVCHQLGIPHYVMDFSEGFHKTIVRNFIDEYMKGRTPNPCVLCNTFVKWQMLLERAKTLGADYLATGHYARIVRDEYSGRHLLLRSTNRAKDQSYALWGLNQAALSRTLFPLGNLKKEEVRQIAEKLGLRTAQKSESQEICFIPDNDYRRFLREQVSDIREGEIVTTDGEVVGTHSGYPFFTIGQRRGIGVGLGRPMYVVEVDPETNRVIIGEKEKLEVHGLIARGINLIRYSRIEEPLSAQIKIRYNDPGAAGTVVQSGADEIRVEFARPRRAVTPGQSVVFYQADYVVGGGIIEKALREGA